MRARELAVQAEKAEISYLDRDILKICTIFGWDEMYSPIQLEGAMKRVEECIHHAVQFVNVCDRIPSGETIERLGKVAKSIENAINVAYSGSAQHGSFLRNGGGEYTPCAFMLMNELDEAIASLKK